MSEVGGMRRPLGGFRRGFNSFWIVLEGYFTRSPQGSGLGRRILEADASCHRPLIRLQQHLVTRVVLVADVCYVVEMNQYMIVLDHSWQQYRCF